MTYESLISKITIPESHIHRIRGEEDPALEAIRYNQAIKKKLLKDSKNWPVFDWILLGLGEDGHTASIFPDSDVLQEKKSICQIATHPVTGQKRITITLPVINHAKNVIFLVTDKSKAAPIATILNKTKDYRSLPAAHVNPGAGKLWWYMDKQAARLL
jgi:6-phosphogluconolactonase